MNNHEPPGSTVVFVGPELPSTSSPLNSQEGKAFRRIALRDGAIFQAYRRSHYIERLYPKSKGNWYVEVTGNIEISHLEYLLNFLKPFSFTNSETGKRFCFNVFKNLREGLSCEDICTLRGALIDALALKYWEQNFWIGEKKCACCDSLEKHGPLWCQESYIEDKCKLEKIRWKIRYLLLCLSLWAGIITVYSLIFCTLNSIIFQSHSRGGHGFNFSTQTISWRASEILVTSNICALI